MRGTLYTQETKDRVEQLRREGKTYTEIRKVYPIPKSTLSEWLGKKYTGIFDRKAQLKHLQRIRKISATTLHKHKTERNAIHAARGAATARTLSMQDVALQKSLLAMLYWAEGKKEGGSVTFANTDPLLIHMYLTMLRRCFPIDEKRLRIRVHLHYYHDRDAAIRYWSRLLRVPRNQFGKLYIKKRSVTKKFRRNFKGICFVIYNNTGLLHEILALGRTLGGLITATGPPGRNRTYITNTASSRSIH